MRTSLQALLLCLLLAGMALASDDSDRDVLDAAAKEALRQDLLTAYRAQTHLILAWDLVYTPGVRDETAPKQIRVEAYADGANVAIRCASLTEDFSIDMLATPDQVLMVLPHNTVEAAGSQQLNAVGGRLMEVARRYAPWFGVEARPARLLGEVCAVPFRTAFGFVVDEAEDDTIRFDFNIQVSCGAEPGWLAEALWLAKDVARPAGGLVALQSVRAELQIDVATGMLVRARVTKQRTGGVMTAERAPTPASPEEWQARMKWVLAKPVSSFNHDFSHSTFAAAAGGFGLLVACTSTDPDVQAVRLLQAVPELVAAAPA